MYNEDANVKWQQTLKNAKYHFNTDVEDKEGEIYHKLGTFNLDLDTVQPEIDSLRKEKRPLPGQLATNNGLDVAMFDNTTAPTQDRDTDTCARVSSPHVVLVHR